MSQLYGEVDLGGRTFEGFYFAALPFDLLVCEVIREFKMLLALWQFCRGLANLFHSSILLQSSG